MQIISTPENYIVIQMNFSKIIFFFFDSINKYVASQFRLHSMHHFCTKAMMIIYLLADNNAPKTFQLSIV